MKRLLLPLLAAALLPIAPAYSFGKVKVEGNGEKIVLKEVLDKENINGADFLKLIARFNYEYQRKASKSQIATEEYFKGLENLKYMKAKYKPDYPIYKQITYTSETIMGKNKFDNPKQEVICPNPALDEKAIETILLIDKENKSKITRLGATDVREKFEVKICEKYAKF